MRVPVQSTLACKTLQEIRLGSALGLDVVGVIRQGRTHLAPGPGFELRGDDRLIVQGTTSQLDTLVDWGALKLQSSAHLRRLAAVEKIYENYFADFASGLRMSVKAKL